MTQDASRLLSLPREIRDQIIILALESLEPPPRSPGAVVTRSRIAKDTSRYGSVQYPVHFQQAFASLTQCNRQLRGELHELFHFQRHDESLTCRLDCMCDLRTLWPTWTCCPGPLQNMRHLEMDFRLFGVAYEDGLFAGNGGPGRMFRPLFELLNRFVHHGYRFFSSSSSGHNLHLQTLIIKLISAEGCEEEDLERIYGSIARRLFQVAASGLLTGKIETIGVRYRSRESTTNTNEYEPSCTVAEWASWGFHWATERNFE